MAVQPADQSALNHIHRLADEEHILFSKESLTAADRERLTKIQVELDRCWDLLRQRRALREMGQDPNAAQLRPPEIVEKYIG